MPRPTKMWVSTVLCAIIGIASLGTAFSQMNSAPVYFHATHPRSDLSLFEAGNAEVFFDQVDTQYPTGQGTTTQLTTQILGSGLSRLGSSLCPISVPSLLQNAYIAYAAWLLPITSSVSVDGAVQIDGWMSSTDIPGWAGGYFFAIADVNPQNLSDNICVLSYNAQGGLGFSLQNSPQHLSTTIFGDSFGISNHYFAAGRSLAFFVGAGSTRQGYQFNVHFDSPTWASGAFVPSQLISNPQTTQPSTTTSAAAGCSISVSLVANPTGGQVPLKVSFYAAVSGANGGVQYDWWFGDGSHVTGNPNMTYTYSNPWNYNVVVHVLDAKGCWSQSSTTVSVTQGPVPEFPSGTLPVVLLGFSATLFLIRSRYRKRG